MEVALRPSPVAGMLVMVRRANLGDELPWSKTAKATVAGGGTRRSNVGYMLDKKYGCTESLESGTLGMSSGETVVWLEPGPPIGTGPGANWEPVLAPYSAGEAGFGLKPGLTAAGNWPIGEGMPPANWPGPSLGVESR